MSRDRRKIQTAILKRDKIEETSIFLVGGVTESYIVANLKNARGEAIMHDYIITSYSVDIKSKTIEICAQDRDQKKESRFIAQNVLTHYFKNILEYNILLDIEEWGIDHFIKNNFEAIEEMRQNCWPFEFKDTQQLKDFIVGNGYKYIRISCSYGLQGWILAQNFQII